MTRLFLSKDRSGLVFISLKCLRRENDRTYIDHEYIVRYLCKNIDIIKKYVIMSL